LELQENNGAKFTYTCFESRAEAAGSTPEPLGVHDSLYGPDGLPRSDGFSLRPWPGMHLNPRPLLIEVGPYFLYQIIWRINPAVHKRPLSR